MRTVTNCRVCESTKLTEILDLGVQYTSDFRENNTKPSKYPIVGVICEECKLVQLKHTTPSQDMYHENYGFKSGVSNSIKADLQDIVYHAQEFKSEPKSWLDIASNDGTLLSYVPTASFKVGVDPIGFLCEEAKEHADLIINDFFPSEKFPEVKFDVVTSISCFYDMDDPNKFVSSVKDVMEDNGIWVIQQNYLLPTMHYNAVDNFCHEHLEYYTLYSLEYLLDKHDLEVIDVSTSMVNGGSIRTIVAKKGVYPAQDSVERQRTIELDAKLDLTETYKDFGERCLDKVKELKSLVDNLNREGKKVYILAASTRGSTIWQAAGITEKDVPYAVERNPNKVGKYFSAVGMPIISEEQARKDHPEFMIVGPWFFKSEIIAREQEYLNKGGHLIIPLPKLEII